MKPIRLLAFGLVFSALAFAAGAPRNLNGLFGSKANLQHVAEAKDVDACVLRYIAPAPRASGETRMEDERYEETAFVALPAATVAELRKAVLDPGSYVFSPGDDGVFLSKLCHPIYHARLRFKRGADVLAVDFCFSCGIARTLRNGKVIAEADFDPSYPVFRNAFLALFPDDPALKKTKSKL